MESSKSLVLKGVFWNAIQLVVNQGFAFIVKLVLAKILLPEQFGLVGMATVFTGFVSVLTELGIGAALIQKKEGDLTREHYDTAFWTGIVWSASLYLTMAFAIAPLAAKFYNEDILKQLIPIISIGILLSPINLVNRAQLSKQMSFKKIARIESTSNVVAGIISILLALWGAGVWSLAFNSTAIIVFAIPFYFRATNWFPKLSWNKKAFKEIFGFGIFTTGTNMINYFVNNVDYLLIGKLLSAQLLGAYAFAFVLTDTFRSRLMAVINNVMYPLYGKKQSDPAAMKRYYLKVVSYNCVIVFPTMLLLFLLAEPFILSFFGAKWVNSILPLKILAVSIMVQMLVNSNTVLIRALGRPGLEMKLQLLKAVVYMPALAYGVYKYGIVGASWAVLFSRVFNVLIAQYTFNYLISVKVTTYELFNEIKGSVLATVFAFIVGSIMLNVLNVNFLIVGLVVLLVFGLSIYKLMGEELSAHVNFMRSKRT